MMALEKFLFEMVFLLAASGFVLCLKMLASPTSARLGNLVGAGAMALAVVATFIAEKPSSVTLIILAMALGSLVGVVFAQKVKMTAMPQMVALFAFRSKHRITIVLWTQIARNFLLCLTLGIGTILG